MTSLSSLIEKLSKATEGSAALDREIMLIDGWVRDEVNNPVPMWKAPPNRTFPYGSTANISGYQNEYPYTRMMDAALSLLPDGWFWRAGSTTSFAGWSLIQKEYDDPKTEFGFHKERDTTPALALVIACLKART